MAGLSNSDISRGSGYQLKKGVPDNNSAILAQRIAVLAEMNTANQSSPLTPFLATSRQQAAAICGWGSPVDIMLRIILANTTLPVWVYPQAAAVSSVANVQTITATGTATANVTHTLLVGGRAFLEGGRYDINITTGMTATQVATAIKNAINGVLGCPVSATADAINGQIKTTSLAAAGSGYSTGDAFNVVGGVTLADGIIGDVTNGALLTASPYGGGGSGYAVNDTFSLNFGGTTPATGKVASITSVPGQIATSNVVAGGTGYAINDTFNISSGGTTANAEVTAIKNGVMLTGTIPSGSGGTGYVVGDTFSLTAEPGGTSALGTVATVASGVVTSVTITSGGSAYTTMQLPHATNITGTGTGLQVQPATLADGVVSTFYVVNKGSGYTTGTKSTTATSGTGTGLTVNVASISTTTGIPATVTILTGGSGYVVSQDYPASTTSGSGIGLYIQALTISTGAVLNYSINDVGSGYSVSSGVATSTSGTGAGFTINILTTYNLPANATMLKVNWTGLTSQDITINILTNGKPSGISYAVAEVTAGNGTPSVQAALDSFGTDRNTIIALSYGILSTSTNALCTTFNGNANTQTGKYNPLEFGPGIYITGSVIDSTTTSADTVITAAQLNEMTLNVGAVPLSLGLPMEGAANYAVWFANCSQDTPNIDIQGVPLPDMPGPLAGSVPSQSNNYTLRNQLMQMGMTTVIYKNGQYIPQDFVTTYAPTGENPPAFRYCRDLMIDFIIEDKWQKLQTRVIENKQIAADNDVVNVPNVVKPKDVKSALVKLAKDLVSDGLTTDAAFMIASISVVINSGNKNRFDISWGYDRSGVTKVISNVATAN